MSLPSQLPSAVTTEVVAARGVVPRRQHQVRLRSQLITELCADYQSRRVSIASLAKEYGVHHQTVARHLREAGIEIKPQPTGIPDSELPLVAQLRAEGLTHKAIAERLGCSRNTARAAVVRAVSLNQSSS